MSLDDVSAYLKVQHRRRGISILPSDWMVPYSEQVSRIAASRERLRRNPKRPKLVVDRQEAVDSVETFNPEPVMVPSHPARDRFKELLKNIPRASAPRDPVSYAILSEDALPTWKRIILETCNKHDVSYNDIRAHRRHRKDVIARQEATWRLRHETLMSLPQIARRMGGFDHSTCCHSIKKHQERVDADKIQTNAASE